jgi:hypothetical protein
MCRRNWLRSWINGCGDPDYPTGPHADSDAWELYRDTYVALMRKAIKTVQDVYDYDQCDPDGDGQDYEDMINGVMDAVCKSIGIDNF